MFVKEYKYTDYFGNKRTKTVRCQLTRSEIFELAFSVEGGYISAAERMIEKRDEPEMMKNYKKLILMSYGEISPDGDRFMKSEEISKAFEETPAYDLLFMDLMDNDNLTAFVKAVVPPDQAAALPDKFDANTLKELMTNADGNNT